MVYAPAGWLGWLELHHVHQKSWWVRFPVRHTLRLRVQSPVGLRTGGSPSMFLSHINVSLSPSLAPQLPLSQKKKNQ